jgi:hypothetical protein
LGFNHAVTRIESTFIKKDNGMFERATVSRVLPFGTAIVFLALNDLLGKAGVDQQQLRWLYPLKTMLIVAMLWFWRAEYTELRWPRGKGVMTWLVALVIGLLVFVAWINLSASWMVIGVSAGFDPRGAGGALDWFFVAFRWIGAAMVVPVMEELFWRSFLMRWIADQNFLTVEPARVGIKAFVIVAVFFAVEHNLWLAGVVAGAAYNFLYIRSGTLWSPILAHGVTNGVLGGWVLLTGSWGYW